MSHDLASIELTAAESAEIADLAGELAEISSTHEPSRFIEIARETVDGRPVFKRIRAVLDQEPCACRIGSFRLGTTEPTPENRPPTFDRVGIPAAILGLVSGVVGSHRGFERESNGRLIHSVAPKRSNWDMQISSSSAVELEMHTELAYAEHQPAFVLLLCVRQGPDAASTLVAPLDVIIDQLPLAVLDVLHEPVFMTTVDIAVRGQPGQRIGPMPVLTRSSSGDLLIRCDLGEIKPTDCKSSDALSAVRSVARSCAHRVVLDVGDLLVIDNNRAMHGRLPFTARFDGDDRWLLRSYVWGTGDAAPAAHTPVVPGTLHGSVAGGHSKQL